jgi:hypothetical protein
MEQERHGSGSLMVAPRRLLAQVEPRLLLRLRALRLYSTGIVQSAEAKGGTSRRSTRLR